MSILETIEDALRQMDVHATTVRPLQVGCGLAVMAPCISDRCIVEVSVNITPMPDEVADRLQEAMDHGNPA